MALQNFEYKFAETQYVIIEMKKILEVLGYHLNHTYLKEVSKLSDLGKQARSTIETNYDVLKIQLAEQERLNQYYYNIIFNN